MIQGASLVDELSARQPVLMRRSLAARVAFRAQACGLLVNSTHVHVPKRKGCAFGLECVCSVFAAAAQPILFACCYTSISEPNRKAYTCTAVPHTAWHICTIYGCCCAGCSDGECVIHAPGPTSAGARGAVRQAVGCSCCMLDGDIFSQSIFTTTVRCEQQVPVVANYCR